MKIQMSRIIFVRVEKSVDVDTVEELINATEEFDTLTDSQCVTTPYFDDHVYLTVEGTVPDVDEYSPLYSFIRDEYTDDEWFHTTDEYIDYVNSHAAHPLHGTDPDAEDDETPAPLQFDLQMFADVNADASDDFDDTMLRLIAQDHQRIFRDVNAIADAISRIRDDLNPESWYMRDWRDYADCVLHDCSKLADAAELLIAVRYGKR